MDSYLESKEKCYFIFSIFLNECSFYRILTDEFMNLFNKLFVEL